MIFLAHLITGSQVNIQLVFNDTWINCAVLENHIRSQIIRNAVVSKPEAYKRLGWTIKEIC